MALISPNSYRMPAEWEPHRASWIAWPHEASDWPGKLESARDTYIEIIRSISQYEALEILVDDDKVKRQLERRLEEAGVSASSYRLHVVSTDRSWLRDSAPSAVQTESGSFHWIAWRFNAWARYDNYHLDAKVPAAVAEISGLELISALRPDNTEPLVLEGGAIETDGEGTLLVTKDCLLNPVQERNPGLSREEYEIAFKRYLGIENTIWLDGSLAGDDTHGHVDTLARFIAPGKVVLAFEENQEDLNHSASKAALRQLETAVDAKGRLLEVVLLPMPKPLYSELERLPATYANFYIANSLVLVPTFADEKDEQALDIISKAFPERRVLGIDCVELVLGQGTLHCLTQVEYVSSLKTAP